MEFHSGKLTIQDIGRGINTHRQANRRQSEFARTERLKIANRKFPPLPLFYTALESLAGREKREYVMLSAAKHLLYLIESK
jgi:hypothetical protein